MLRTLIICLALALPVTGFTQEAAAPASHPQVVIRTSEGDITVRLFDDKSPVSVANFLVYVDSGFYNGTIFHRVIPNFMIQGGGMDAQMKERKGSGPIKNEAGNGLKNNLGTIAMARTSSVDSATSQFFINVKNNDFLNHRSQAAAEYGYAVFGQVVEGMDVVQAIEKVKTTSKGHHDDVPVDPVVIHSITVEP